MEVENKIGIEYSRQYLKSRNNITLVIEYLEKLKDNKGTIQINNDCVKLLMESLKTQSELYLEVNQLPIDNHELTLQNHTLKVQNKQLQEQIKLFMK